jgi:hypothetical protein
MSHADYVQHGCVVESNVFPTVAAPAPVAQAPSFQQVAPTFQHAAAPAIQQAAPSLQLAAPPIAAPASLLPVLCIETNEPPPPLTVDGIVSPSVCQENVLIFKNKYFMLGKKSEHTPRTFATLSEAEQLAYPLFAVPFFFLNRTNLATNKKSQFQVKDQATHAESLLCDSSKLKFEEWDQTTIASLSGDLENFQKVVKDVAYRCLLHNFQQRLVHLHVRSSAGNPLRSVNAVKSAISREPDGREGRLHNLILEILDDVCPCGGHERVRVEFSKQLMGLYNVILEPDKKTDDE